MGTYDGEILNKKELYHAHKFVDCYMTLPKWVSEIERRGSMIIYRQANDQCNQDELTAHLRNAFVWLSVRLNIAKLDLQLSEQKSSNFLYIS